MNDFGLSTDISKEKLYAAAKIKKQQQQQTEQQKEVLQKQDPSQSTGLQWASAQAQVQSSTQTQKTETADIKAKSSQPVILAPDIEDVAMLSSMVSVKSESIKAPQRSALTRLASNIIDIGSLEESYKEFFKKSKSHNLLLERFMSHMKFSGMKMLLSALGVSANEQNSMQKEVRDQALAEIDQKLKEDWAYTKAMTDITG